MLRSVGLAIGSFLIVAGLAAFVVEGATWRRDAFSEWRSEWMPAVTIEEQHPWLLCGAGFAVLVYTKAISKA